MTKPAIIYWSAACPALICLAFVSMSLFQDWYRKQQFKHKDIIAPWVLLAYLSPSSIVVGFGLWFFG